MELTACNRGKKDELGFWHSLKRKPRAVHDWVGGIRWKADQRERRQRKRPQ